MRKLEDCKAEIFRRSEERIKERKRNRNRVFAWCISLCLLLVVGGIYVGPRLQPVDELAGMNAEDCAIPDRVLGGVQDYAEVNVEETGDTTTGSELAGNSVYYTFVEVTDKTGTAEVSWQITDTEKVDSLCDFMRMYWDMSVAKETVSTDISEAIINELKAKYKLEEKAADYKLVFCSSVGDEVVFRLCGNVLYDDRYDCAVALTEESLAVLKLRLGLTEGNGLEE